MFAIPNSSGAHYHNHHKIIPSSYQDVENMYYSLRRIERELTPHVRTKSRKFIGDCLVDVSDDGPYSDDPVKKLSTFDNYFTCEDTAEAMKCAVPRISEPYQRAKTLYEKLKATVPSYQVSTSIVTNVRSCMSNGVIKEKTAVKLLNCLMPRIQKISPDADQSTLEADLSLLIIDHLKRSSGTLCFTDTSYVIHNQELLGDAVSLYVEKLNAPSYQGLNAGG